MPEYAVLAILFTITFFSFKFIIKSIKSLKENEVKIKNAPSVPNDKNYETVKTTDKKFCKNCKKEIEKDSIFCKYCGSKQ